MASMNAARFPVLALLAVLLAAVPAFAQKGQSLFTVANLTAGAEANDLVEAKRLATQDASMRAFRILVSRLTGFKERPRIPELPAEEVDHLISGIGTNREGVTGTSYVATFSVSFQERAVNALFARHGVVPILDRGPEILIVPVFIEDGTARTGDRNPWRNALLELDLTHALVPAKVAPSRSDLTAAVATSYAANASAGVEALKTQYRTGQILLAVASTSSGSDTVTLSLAGHDAMELFSVQRKVKGGGTADSEPLREAAKLAFETVQERWKLTHSFDSQAPREGGGTSASGASGETFVGGGGELSSMAIVAQFSGLKEWNAIRSRLQNLPGLQNWDLKSVNPRSATISFDFPGGAARLTAMAGAQGLAVENGPDGLIVKTR